MHRSILEARVIDVVERILDGGRNEDDHVEVKSDWPDSKKFPRQLAGSANRSAGSDIIVVVGINDKTYELVSPSAIDPESWWSQVQSGFEGGATPDLVNNLVVPLPSGGAVIALAFETDGAPYVVKNPDGKAPHLEVPMRTATGTGWAKRSDLIRMLARRVTTPNVLALNSKLHITWSKSTGPQSGRKGRDDVVSGTAGLLIFIEHLSSEYVMLPHHGMKAELLIGGSAYETKIEHPYRRKDATPSRHGVEARHDGLLLTGPGQAIVRCAVRFPLEAIEQLRMADVATVHLVMAVTGNDVPVRLTFRFARSEKPKDEGPLHEDLGTFMLSAE